MNKTAISTNKAPAAIGPYSQAIKTDNLLFVSGQIPMNPETGELVDGGIKQQAEQVLKNLKEILLEAGTSMDQVLKTTVFLKDMEDFNDFNETYATFFKENPPARACVEVARLPKDVIVEIEAIAAV